MQDLDETNRTDPMVVVVVVGVAVTVFVVVVAVVTVEWLYYSNRIIVLLDGLILAIFSLIFVGKMCVFVSRPMNIVTFLRKNGETPKRVVHFPRDWDIFRGEIVEIVGDFYESHNNNGKPWKS